MKVFIWGSAVSRECFKYPSASSFELAACYVRCSCASAMSAPIPLDGINLDAVASKFKRQTIVADFQKQLLRDLVTKDFDILLIDFIDERFPLRMDAEGRVVTVSAELQETGSVDMTDERLIQVGNEKRFTLWREAWDRFMDFCSRHGIKDKIVLNCVRWADRMEDGAPITGVSAGYIARNNTFLNRIYDTVIKDISASQCIHYPDRLIIANRQHHWGISPLNYIDETYKYALSQITNCCTRVENAPESAAVKPDCFSTIFKTANPFLSVKEIAKLVTPDKEIFSYPVINFSLENMSPLKKGRFRVFIKDIIFECLFEPSESEYLCVSLSSAGVRKQYPFFTRWSWSKLFSCNFLSIEDPMYSKHKTSYALWYYGTEDTNYLDMLVDIVLKVAEHLHIDKSKIVFLGSSAGGYAALYCSAKIKDSIALSIAPQMDISVYPGNKYLKDIINLTSTDKRNNIYWITKTESTYAISYNIADQHDYHQQFLPFAREIGYTPKFGISTHNNIIFWLYYANAKKPHNVGLSPFHSLFLFSLAKKYASGCNINFAEEFSIILNEDIRAITAYKEKYEDLILSKGDISNVE